MIEALQEAVQRIHKCRATFREVVPVIERFKGHTVWEGHVHIFDLEGHPKATRCYAWASPIEGSKKEKIYAVLHVLPISSPEEAVGASIIRDYKSGLK